MTKWPASEIPRVEEFFDFSTLKAEAPRTFTHAAEIASRLVQDEALFKGTFGAVLKDVANDLGLSEPTQEERQSIRDNIRCKVRLTEHPGVYMRCDSNSDDIFINEQVHLFLHFDDCTQNDLICDN